MRRRQSTWLLLVGIAALFPVLAAAAAGADVAVWSEPRTVKFESLSLSDGLSDSTIFSISQDQRGRIWFGSAAGGAMVFDGYRVRAFQQDPDDPASLSHSAAGEVLATRDGSVLVGTWGGGVNRLADREGRYERLNAGASPSHVQVMHEASDGRVWVGSADSGLYRLDDPRGQLVAQARVDGRPFERIWSIAEAPDGTIWVATEQGVFEVHGDRSVRTPAGGWVGHPRALVHAEGALWVGDNETIYRVDGDTPRAVLTELPRVNTLMAGTQGQILVGTLAGFRAMDGGGRPVGPFGLPELVLFPERNIRRFYFDRSGVGWIATREAGVIKAQPTVPGFDGHALATSLDTADTVLELARDDVLIGSRRGIWRLRQRDGQTEFYRLPGTETHPINRFYRMDDIVLVGTGTGVYRFDPQSEVLEPAPRFERIAGQMVTALRSYPDGAVDVGTWAGGLFRFSASGEVVNYVPGGALELPDVAISDVEPDGAGGVWLGLWNEGVAHIGAAGEVMTVPTSELGIDGHVHDLLPVDDELWVATSFGLVRFAVPSRESQRLILIPDFPNTSVQRLAVGPQRLWAATTRGIIAIDREDRSMTRFGTSDGLVIEEFFARSGHVGEGGRVYFGGLGGFVSFFPEQVELALSPPGAAVISAWIDGGQVAVGDRIEVPPGSNSLRLRFIAADFRNAEANRFRWRLDGARDGAWSAVTADAETLLVGLDPGRYRFELQAANGNGLWNRDAASLAVVVRPAWWQTVWGQGLVVLAVVLLVWGWNFWNTQRIRSRNRELRREVDRQTRALKEANRSLAQAASTDYLTGLLNRRGFLAEVEHAEPGSEDYYALADVDNFKSFNDIYGHDVGDLVLQHVAKVMREAAGDDALPARWGGEEFIVRIHAESVTEATAVAERIRLALEANQPDVGRAIPAILVTMGVAHRRAGESCIQAINRADTRLLEGKQQGKNRVVAPA